MTTPTIQPCPFCGDTDPAIDQVELGVWAIVCNDCNCTGPIQEFHTGKGQSAELAIELWNKRPRQSMEWLSQALNEGDGVYRP